MNLRYGEERLAVLTHHEEIRERKRPPAWKRMEMKNQPGRELYYGSGRARE